MKINPVFLFVILWLPSISTGEDKENNNTENSIEDQLNKINDISSNAGGSMCGISSLMVIMFQDVPINTHFARIVQKKMDLIVSLLDMSPFSMTNLSIEFKDIEKKINQTLEEEFGEINQTHHSKIRLFKLRLLYFQSSSDSILHIENGKEVKTKSLVEQPWFINPTIPANFTHNFQSTNSSIVGRWTWPYYVCNTQTKEDGAKTKNGSWLISYTTYWNMSTSNKHNAYGILSIDIDISNLDINQCGIEGVKKEEHPLSVFWHTHKCDIKTSTCHFTESKGWMKGSYECRCIRARFAENPNWENKIPGHIAEIAWSTSLKLNLTKALKMGCMACPKGCENCTKNQSCIAPTNLLLRIILLSISIFCSVGTVVIFLVVYKYRRLPVFKSSSPIFHCITLFGCIIMYSEMIALFPELNSPVCITVKWMRHLGFCITYTALYMKLCRVYLTFRVKSAHKIKLTEKHLLHWMSPIMVIMLLYLCAWTLSAPPGVQTISTNEDLKFHQCDYNWWDHALAIGELIFLCYGIWICWRIRENPDAMFISYSIYNIAFVNVLMLSLHLIFFPNVGPDIKYLFAFIRIQLSTTVTIGLVFGSKLWGIVRGSESTMKEITNSNNGFGHDNLDLEEENAQLKEELQKLATQIERLKVYAMCKNNPHLKQHNSSLHQEFANLELSTL